MGSSAPHVLSGRTTMSIDHYLRLDLPRLAQLRWRHLESQVDSEGLEAGMSVQGEGACLAQQIGGYTEWLDSGGEGYSVGWDWYVQVPQGSLAVAPHSIRTNIMLVNASGEDLGRARTEEDLEHWLQSWDWASSVLQALRSDAADPSGER